MQDNPNKPPTLTTFGSVSADVDFLAILQKFIEREAERRQGIVPFWLAIRIDGVLQSVIDSESWCLFEFEGGTSKVELVGRDAEGEVVIATYLPTYDGPKTEAWKVSLPSGDEVSCTFEYDSEERVRVWARRIVKAKLGEMRSAYVERLRNGDLETERHFWKFLHLKLRSPGMPSYIVEDLQRKTYFRVITALRQGGEIREPERFGALLNSVWNDVRVEFNKLWKTNYPLGGAHVEIPDGVMDLEAAPGGKQPAEHLPQILDAMPTRDRNVLRAIFLEERDEASVCREFGVDREYLRVLVHRAKDKLRSLHASLAAYEKYKDRVTKPEERQGPDEKSAQDRGQNPAHSSRDKI